MKKWTMLAAAACLLAACNDSSNTVDTITNVQDTLQEAVVEDEMAVVTQSFPQLFQYLRQQDPTFSEDSFMLAGENKVESVAPAAIDSARLQPFRNLLIYNSDSSLALDLYSYNYIATNRNGKTKFEEAGPDSEAAVLDFKRGTRKRVFFGGPSHTLWDAKWINANELLLIGAETGAENNVIPTIWQVNLQNTSTQVFAYQGKVAADLTDYRNQKLSMGF